MIFFPLFGFPPTPSKLRSPPRLFNEKITKKLLELTGLILIGDGLMGLLRPRRHSLLWHVGPQLAKAVTEELADHPNTARSIYAAEVALGIAVASIALSDTNDL